MEKLSHINKDGKANMVDVGNKSIQVRIARAEGCIFMNGETLNLIKENKMKKGDVLTVAEIAGIQGGKKTSELIPLCHSLQITKIDVKTEIRDDHILVSSYAKCIGQTGIEMEAMTAVSIALLAIYDMCKAVDKKMTIGKIKLIEKIKSDLDE